MYELSSLQSVEVTVFEHSSQSARYTARCDLCKCTVPDEPLEPFGFFCDGAVAFGMGDNRDDAFSQQGLDNITV